jgi:hypothetical protein
MFDFGTRGSLVSAGAQAQSAARSGISGIFHPDPANSIGTLYNPHSLVYVQKRDPKMQRTRQGSLLVSNY